MSLSDIRSRIDAIDQDLLRLLTERVTLGRAARMLKERAKDSAREDEVLALWRTQAKQLGLDPKRVDAVLKAVLDLTRSAQEP